MQKFTTTHAATLTTMESTALVVALAQGVVSRQRYLATANNRTAIVDASHHESMLANLKTAIARLGLGESVACAIETITMHDKP